LTLKIPATLIKKPPKPVAIVPVQNLVISPEVAVKRNSMTFENSMRTMRGSSRRNVRMLVYQARSITDEETVMRDCLIIITWMAVQRLPVRPKKIPSGAKPRTPDDVDDIVVSAAV